MRMRVKVSGLRDLEMQLEDLGEKIATKVLREAGREIMQPVLEDMQAHSGFDNSHDDEHMRDSIKIRTTSRMKEGRYPTIMTIRVGPSKVHHMKAQAQEFGTSKQIPHPFIRPALDYNREQILNSIAAEIKAAIKS